MSLAVNESYPEAKKGPSEFLTKKSNFDFEARKSFFEQKIQEFGKSMGIENKVSLKITNSECAETGTRSNEIEIPFWYLFQYEDLPEKFRVSGIEDTKFEEETFLPKARKWMTKRIDEADLANYKDFFDVDDDNCPLIERTPLIQILIFLSNKNFHSKKAIEFVLAHELAHISHANQTYDGYIDKTPVKLRIKRREEKIKCIFTALITLASIGNFFIPDVNMMVASSLFGFLSIMSLNKLYTLKGLADNEMQNSENPRLGTKEEEKNADLDAAKIPGLLDGGICYFKTYIEYNKSLQTRFDIEDYLKFYDMEGNFALDTSHPPLTERLEYLIKEKARHELAKKEHPPLHFNRL